MLRSLTVRIALLLAVFAAVPVLLYGRFERADRAYQDLMLDLIRERGALVARALQPLLAVPAPPAPDQVEAELLRFAQGADSLKMLLRLDERAERGFFYVAAAPPVAPDELDREREVLANAGVLERLGASCEGNVPIALRVERADGSTQLLSSLTPLRVPYGCWVLVGASALDPGDPRIDRPYWSTPEVRLALIVYLALALIVAALVASVWRSLRAFTRTARAIGAGHDRRGFAARNRIPELRGVAAAFDRMVDSLGTAARRIRDAAEEKAHGFKTPLATVRQALAQLRADSGADAARRARAAELAAQALDRLDGLVREAREVDRGTADLLEIAAVPVELGAMARAVAATCAREPGPRIEIEAGRPVQALADPALLRTALQGAIENAVGFSPPDRPVRITLAAERDAAVLRVIDRGPGVAAADLPRIFARGFSKRPDGAADGHHSGLGLWVAHRNVTAMGGALDASVSEGGGLTLTFRLPLVRPQAARP